MQYMRDFQVRSRFRKLVFKKVVLGEGIREGKSTV